MVWNSECTPKCTGMGVNCGEESGRTPQVSEIIARFGRDLCRAGVTRLSRFRHAVHRSVPQASDAARLKSQLASRACRTLAGYRCIAVASTACHVAQNFFRALLYVVERPDLRPKQSQCHSAPLVGLTGTAASSVFAPQLCELVGCVFEQNFRRHHQDHQDIPRRQEQMVLADATQRFERLLVTHRQHQPYGG
jgi:hypothetical protein